MARPSLTLGSISIRRAGGRGAAALVFLAALFCGRGATGQVPSSVPWGLFSARYDTRTSDFIYAVYGYGSNFGMVAVLHNPRTDYSEVLGGIGRNFAMAGQTQSVALAVSHASDAWYAQLYYLPSLHRGDLSLRATTELYVPLERGGTTQFAFSPVSMTFGAWRSVEAGVAADVGIQQGSASSVGAGPEVRVAIPKATIGVDLQHIMNGSSSRLRLFFLTSF